MLGSLLILLSGLAVAQDIEAPQPVIQPTVDGRMSFFTDEVGLRDDRGATARVMSTLANQAFAREGEFENDFDAPISRTDIMAGYQAGLLRLAADVPVYALGVDTDGALRGGIGDVRFDARASFLDLRDNDVGFAVQGRGWLPSTTLRREGFRNDSGGFSAMLIGEALTLDDNLKLAANLGFDEFDYDPSLTDEDFGDDAFARLNAGVGISERLGLSADVEGRWRFDEEQYAADIPEAALLAMLGAWGKVGQAFDISAGIGAETGWSSRAGGDSEIHPRASLLVNYTGQMRRDRDLDGFANLEDDCPDVYGTDDGCPVEEAVAVVETEPEVIVIEREVLVPAKPAITIDETGMLELDETIFFAFDSTVLTPKAQAVLNQVAMELEANPNVDMVWIKGHADERGTAEYNIELSRARAKAVYDYLTQQGVQASRLDTVAFGESRPADPRSTPAAWQKNRRVEFEAVYEAPN